MAPFTYERVKEFTGKVQFRVDGPSVATLSGRTVKRGEVLAFEKESFANAIVQTGNYAHVPADTPLGVPVHAEEAPTPATTEPGETAASAPMTLAVEEEI